MSEQYLLNFPKAESRRQKLKPRFALRLAVLRWLFSEEGGGPDAVGFDVPVRVVGLKADLLASWHAAERQKKLRMSLLVPQRVVLVVCAETRAECWPECANPEEILREIGRLRAEMDAAEKEIRSNEPHLLDNNMLFEEFAIWNYGKSKDSDYPQLRSRVQALEQSLYKGTRLEKIARLGLADALYLAVPESEVQPHELIDGWGLLSVAKNLELTVLREPVRHKAPPEARMHLVQNMLCSGRDILLKENGLQIMRDGSSRFVKPRRPRKTAEILEF